jgi:hypothetical protein
MGLTAYLAHSSAWGRRLPAPLPGATIQPPRMLRGKRTWRCGSRAWCGGIASGRFARAAVGAQRRVNEDTHDLQTMACCEGLPRESHVAFATVILHTLFTCLRAFMWRIRVRGVRRARFTSAWTRRTSEHIDRGDVVKGGHLSFMWYRCFLCDTVTAKGIDAANRINPPKSRSVQNRCRGYFPRIPASAAA